MIKLVHGSKTKMVKLEQPSFQKLLQHINQTYPHLPTDYTLTYLDHDQDEICISSDEDLAIMLSAGNKYSKVYVKESLSQVLDMSSYMTGDVQLEVYESKIGEAKVEEKEPIKENLKVEVRVDAEKEESVASRKSSGWSVPAEIEVDSRPEAREVFKVEQPIIEAKVEESELKLTLEEMEKLDFFYDEKEKKEYLDQLRSQRKQAGKAKDSKAEEALIQAQRKEEAERERERKLREEELKLNRRLEEERKMQMDKVMEQLRRKEEQKQEEERRKREEEDRLMKEEERLRKEENRRRQQQARKIEEEAKRREEEARRREEQQRLRKEDRQRQVQEERQRAKRRMEEEEEKLRLQEIRRFTEYKRFEENRKREEEQRKRKDEDLRRLEEDQRRIEEDIKRQKLRKEKQEAEALEATIKAEALRLAKQMMEDEKRSKVQEPELVYHEKRCSKCKDDYGIIGDRYECLLCDGFHLCQKCETTVIHAHALLKIKRLDQANTRELVERRFGKPKPDVRKREEAEKSLVQAERILKEGYERSQKVLADMFGRLRERRNSWDGFAAEEAGVKVESNEVRAKYLADAMGEPYIAMLTFVKRYPEQTAEQCLQTYIRQKTGNRR